MSRHSRIKRHSYKQQQFATLKDNLTEEDAIKTDIWYINVDGDLCFTDISAVLTQTVSYVGKIEKYYIDKNEVSKHVYLGVKGSIEYDLKLLPNCPDEYRLYGHCVSDSHKTSGVFICGTNDSYANIRDYSSESIKSMSYSDFCKMCKDRQRLRKELLNLCDE